MIGEIGESVSSPESPVIVVQKVSKIYHRTGHRVSLRHEAMSLVSRWFKRSRRLQAEPFFALQNVSFSVTKGEGLGIIGRNGSGKTTLLRVLSGIVQPTSGQVQVKGRFASLIGLSAGFISEMSGRKNIYLNAAMFGVPPRQVDQIIDKIIDFAEIDSFIDTPVKHYSSGMGARLGFSIAIHILPDIILLDEVLAVGDSAFQKKCMDRMLQLKAERRTFVVVSHSPEALQLLCERTIWLNKGCIMADGPTDEVAKAYAAM